jgi:arabinofuranosyltransferase
MSKQRLYSALGLLLAAAVLAYHAIAYLPFLSDDALISFRYAQRLITGHGLTWTDGIAVEGYSNLLWVLAIAALGALGIDLITAARVLGFLAMCTAPLAVLLWNRHANGGRVQWLAWLTAVSFFVLSAPIAIWVVGGLEQPLLAALLSLALPGCLLLAESRTPQRKTALIAGACLALLALTRPDGPLFTVAACLGIALARLWRGQGPAPRVLIWLVALPAAAYLAQLAFRLGYYGEWVPNTALVKLTPSLPHFQGGLGYVAHAWQAHAPWAHAILAFLLGALLFLPRLRPRSLVLLLLGGTWLSYVAFIGGDIFPGWRHFVPLLVILMFGLDEAMRWLLGRFTGHPRATAAAWLVLLVLLQVGYVRQQWREPENLRARQERWEWDGKVLATTLKQAFAAEQPLLAVTAAGCLPYWSELPALDMLGLNDHFLARHPPADLGKGYLGHELGNGRYVLDRQPDLITFNVGSPTPSFRSGAELQTLPEFHARYTPVRILGTQPHHYVGTVFVARHSAKVGMRQNAAGELEVPAYLFSDHLHTVARIGPLGNLVIVISREQPARITLPFAIAQDRQPQVIAARGVQARLHSENGETQIELYTDLPGELEVHRVVLGGASATGL